MNNAVLSIYCLMSVVAFAKAKTDTGPQTFDETPSQSLPQRINKEYGYNTQVITLYLTPSDIKALFDSKGNGNTPYQIIEENKKKQQDVQSYKEEQKLNENKQNNTINSPNDELKAELRGLLSHNSFYASEKNYNFENRLWNYDFSKIGIEQIPKKEEKQVNYSYLNKNQPQAPSRENQGNLQKENMLNKQLVEENENKQQDIQNYKREQKLNDNKQNNKMNSPNDELKAELRGLLSHNSFYSSEKNNNFENRLWNYDFSKFGIEQNPKKEEKQINYSYLNKNQQQAPSLENQGSLQQGNMLNKQFEWKPSNPESITKENIFNYEQLQKPWNNNAYQNPSQLKSLSNQDKNVKTVSVENNSKVQNSIEEKSEVEKQIESILKQQQTSEDKRQTSLAQIEADSRKLPIFISKEVSITRHHPVPVVKKVKVPTPVLVPIPEPYEVRIPHPYPVPYKIIKHIPIPVVKNY